MDLHFYDTVSVIYTLKIAQPQKFAIFRLLNLHYICRGSPCKHLVISSTEFCQEITALHGLEVEQFSSTIFWSHGGRKCPIFLMISFLYIYLSSLMQAKNISCGMIG